MRYRCADGVSLPFRLLPLVTEVGRTRVEVSVKLRAAFDPSLTATSVVVLIPVPPTAAAADLHASHGKAKYDPKKGALVWKIARLAGGADAALAGAVRLVSTTRDAKPWARPPASLSFQVPMFSASGLRIQYLKVRRVVGVAPTPTPTPPPDPHPDPTPNPNPYPHPNPCSPGVGKVQLQGGQVGAQAGSGGRLFGAHLTGAGGGGVGGGGGGRGVTLPRAPSRPLPAAPMPPPPPPRTRDPIPVDVAVVGGGVSGTLAAAALARDGATVRLLDAAPAPGGVWRTAANSYSTLQVGGERERGRAGGRSLFF